MISKRSTTQNTDIRISMSRTRTVCLVSRYYDEEFYLRKRITFLNLNLQSSALSIQETAVMALLHIEETHDYHTDHR